MTNPTSLEPRIHAFTDADPPMPIRIPLSAVHVLRPVGKRSPELKDRFELLYYAGFPAQQHRATVTLDDVARAVGWHATSPRSEAMTEAFANTRFYPEGGRPHPSRQIIPPMPYEPGDPSVYAVTDTDPFEHLTIPLANIRVMREITAERSPARHAVGWIELLFVAGFPARPYRALVDCDQLACGLGWFAGIWHNRPIADHFDEYPFYPERRVKCAFDLATEAYALRGTGARRRPVRARARA